MKVQLQKEDGKSPFQPVKQSVAYFSGPVAQMNSSHAHANTQTHTSFAQLCKAELT